MRFGLCILSSLSLSLVRKPCQFGIKVQRQTIYRVNILHAQMLVERVGQSRLSHFPEISEGVT
ncbi:hypothetical protein [Sphingomonas sp. Mn802worker]|uniref:hypothetical protein n=1 Tax=Sphingomonas sp. Mn802worker TaxID=629773 RepID=UPI0003794481|nr:hypothetical protein [Sphingomonas sp. Mn802worker]